MKANPLIFNDHSIQSKRLSLLQRFQGGLYAVIAANPGVTVNNLPSVTDRLIVISQTVEKLQLCQSFSLADWQSLIHGDQDLLPFVLLPLLLFRHEYADAFQEQLSLLVKANYLNATEQSAIAVWFQILSLILREKFERDQELEKWQEREKQDDFLKIVARAIAEQWPLAQIAHALAEESRLTQSVILGLYSWLDTPDHFALSWQRTAIMGNFQASFFASTFSGVYNGLIGIPSPWYLGSSSPVTNLDCDSLNKFHDHLGQTLYRKWLGALASETSQPMSAIALAAPQVMQRRPSLKLISQCESSD